MQRNIEKLEVQSRISDSAKGAVGNHGGGRENTFEASEEEAFELEEDEAVVAVRTSTNGWFGLVWFGGDHQHWKKGLMGKILGIWSEAECGGECKTWILLWVDGSE